MTSRPLPDPPSAAAGEGSASGPSLSLPEPSLPPSPMPPSPLPPRSLVIGLIGSGIGASLSPGLQEAEARAHGLTLAYRIVDLDGIGTSASDVGSVLDWGQRLGFDGFNVTHPAKQVVREFLDEESPAAALLGAVNTVVLRGYRRVGHNTDWTGFDRGLTWQLGDAPGPVVLLGAGGAGVAVAHALLTRGSEVRVHDLDPARAADLVERLAPHHPAAHVSVVADLAADLATARGLVNATAVGMAAHPGLPLDPDLLRPDLWVADCVYRPLATGLLRAAAARGCRVAHGGGMAVHQAALGFELFTGVAADLDRMTAHLQALIAEPVTT